MAGGEVLVVRVYGDPGRSGREHRVLVDRLWPRGVPRSAIDLDEWAKDAAPSAALRRWYGHDPTLFSEFSRRYREELEIPPALETVDRLRSSVRVGRLVLLTATRDIEHSGAAVLAQVLHEGLASSEG